MSLINNTNDEFPNKNVKLVVVMKSDGEGVCARVEIVPPHLLIVILPTNSRQFKPVLNHTISFYQSSQK